MTAHLQRALALMHQSRLDLAEGELRQHLADDPNHATAHALLALCLEKREEYARATEEAQTAIHLAPDIGLAHYALAKVMYTRNRHQEAEAAIREALRLEPNEADYFWLLSAIDFDRRNWRAALAAAEEGLGCEPEHVGCNNLRAMALTKLGRHAEAGATIAAALGREPENAVSHANQGWSLLEKGDTIKALEHFREALRLNPHLDWARQGIVEALKSRHWIYRQMLRYFLWMSKLTSKAQWGVIIGGYVGFQVLRRMADQYPAISPLVWPCLGIYIVFIYLTWIAQPLFNLLLRCNRFGRLVLSRDETVASNWIGGCLLVLAISLAVCVGTGSAYALELAVASGLLIVPLAGTFQCHVGWPRRAMACYTAGVALVGAAAVALLWFDSEATMTALTVLLVSAYLSPWIANGLMSVRPKL